MEQRHDSNAENGINTATPTVNPQPDSFDAVYYAQQVPASSESLTLLGLVFDRLFFPGVYLPTSEFDEEALRDEIKRIVGIPGRLDVDDKRMLQCMEFSLHAKYVRDFCIFTGNPGMMGTMEQGAGQLMMALEELVFGPPPPGFIPTPSLGFCKGFHFSENVVEHQVNAPSWLAYPANALVYSTRHSIPLINDSLLPVPGVPTSPKDNAKLLAIILAIESVRLALPKLKPMSPQMLQEFRAETVEHVKPFRMSMLRLSKELNAALTSDLPLSEVQRHAKFLVETTIYPQLSELESAINDREKPWYRWAVDLARAVPELATNFMTMPKNIAFAKFLGEIAKVLVDVRDEQLDRENKRVRSGLYFLLKLRGTLAQPQDERPPGQQASG